MRNILDLRREEPGRPGFITVLKHCWRLEDVEAGTTELIFFGRIASVILPKPHSLAPQPSPNIPQSPGISLAA